MTGGSAQTPITDHLRRFAEQLRDPAWKLGMEQKFISTSWCQDVRDAIARAIDAHLKPEPLPIDPMQGCPHCEWGKSNYGTHLLNKCPVHQRVEDLQVDIGIRGQIENATTRMLVATVKALGGDESDDPVALATGRMEELLAFEAGEGEAPASGPTQDVHINGRVVTLSGIALELLQVMEAERAQHVSDAFSRGYEGGRSSIMERVRFLVKLLHDLDRGGGLGLAVHERIKSAIALATSKPAEAS